MLLKATGQISSGTYRIHCNERPGETGLLNQVKFHCNGCPGERGFLTQVKLSTC